MKRVLLFATAIFAATSAIAVSKPSPPPAPQCDPGNAGLKLRPGFCATLFAESLSSPRHMAVAANGDVIAAIRSTQQVPGGVVILRDSKGSGHADSRNKFGDYSASEVALLSTALYTETGSAILRYDWPSGAMAPKGQPDTIVGGLPGTGNHTAKTFVIHRGSLYVNHGSGTNSCQEKDRAKDSKGIDPCPELSERAGIWRFSATKTGQTLKDGEHFATGIRNAVAIAFEPGTRELFVVQHGRDQLSASWGFSDEKSAETPAEELLHVTKGADFGWPYCYYDSELKLKVLAPEYGGDGKTVGRCATKQGNVGVFPAHWAPDGLFFYTGKALPAKYHKGAFIVFHGSWNRAPLPQAGFKVVFQPMANGRAVGRFETFVDGFVGADGKPTELGGRPMGLMQGPHGELYLSDDAKGRIFRIQYVGR